MKKILFIGMSLILSIGYSEKVSQFSSNKIQWINNLDSAFVISSKSNKIIMIDFMAEWCPPCEKMDKETFSNVEIIKKSNEFIPVQINIEKQQDIANKYNGNARKYGGKGIPNILFLDKNKNVINHIVGFHDVNQLMGIMDSILTIGFGKR